MKKAKATYEIINGLYHIELTIDGIWVGGGTTPTANTYEKAYDFAYMVANSKDARLDTFRRLE